MLSGGRARSTRPAPRAEGRRRLCFLVVPAPSRWWFDRYPLLDQLDTVVDEDACRIVARRDRLVIRGPDRRPWRKWWRLLRRIPPYVSPYRKLATASMGAMLLGVLFSLAAPWPLALLSTVHSVTSRRHPRSRPCSARRRWCSSSSPRSRPAHQPPHESLERLGRVREHEPVSADDPRLPLRGSSRMRTRLSQAFHDGSHTGVFIVRGDPKPRTSARSLCRCHRLSRACSRSAGCSSYRSGSHRASRLLSSAVVPFIDVSTGYYANKSNLVCTRCATQRASRCRSFTRRCRCCA